MSDKTDFAEEWIEELEYQQYKNIQVDTIRKMEKLVADMFVMLSKQYEEYGYKYFYEADEEEVTETCEANGWDFLCSIGRQIMSTNDYIRQSAQKYHWCKYYSVMRSVSIGTYPKTGMMDFINYDDRTEVNGRMVWAELYYNRKLT